MASLSTPPSSVRRACLQVLHRVDQGLFIQEAVAEVQARSVFSARDRQLLTELCYGLLRAELRLDCVLEHFLPDRERLPKSFKDILSIAIYSLLFLDRIPPHAALSCAVSEARELYGKTLANLANAVLRAFLRTRALFLSAKAYVRDQEPRDEQPLHALARFYGLPYWLLHFFEEHYGLANALFLATRSWLRPRTGLVVHATSTAGKDLLKRLATAAENQPTDIARIGPRGFALESRAFQRLFSGENVASMHAEGLFSYQSAGSQMVVRELGLDRWKGPVWDMCAGYGGKSAFLADCGVGPMLCSDLSASRLSGLRQDFSRRRYEEPLCVRADATLPPLRSFDGHLLVDAPCSGLGILARRPDLRRSRKTKRSLRRFPREQKAILTSAMKLLASGRELAYITCTLNPAENEEQVKWLLATYTDLTLLRVWQTPHVHPFCEGMYGALLRRR